MQTVGPIACCLCLTGVELSTSTVEISAKYLETSSKTGHNIGEWCMSVDFGIAISPWYHMLTVTGTRRAGGRASFFLHACDGMV